MINFFRRFRQDVIIENRIGKYFIYAISETILIVLGIFIALQLDNWNNERVESIMMKNYYERMHNELQFRISSHKNYQLAIDKIRQKNKRSLELLNFNNRDSLLILKETLGALGTNYTANSSTPIFDDFFEQNYLLKVKNDSIKRYLTKYKFFLSYEKDVVNRSIQTQYHSRIEPYFIKNINYSNVAEDRFKVGLVDGGPDTDYSVFYNNLELWNLLTFKLESLNMQNVEMISIIDLLEKLDQHLENELENNLVN